MLRSRATAALLAAGAVCWALPAAGAPPVVAEDGSVHTSTSKSPRHIVRRATAGGPTRNVAIVAAASGDIQDPFFTDPRDRLLASGEFATVAVIDAGQTTPNLAELLAYDAVLVWSNLSFADAEALGDRLAEYVNAGGGVVLAVFANSTTTNGRFLAGRWLAHGYEIIPAAGGTASGSAALGTIHVPGHPLIDGVTTFAGGTGSFRPTTTAVYPSATVIADWDDGSTLLALRGDTVGSRVDLGFYPPSNDVPGFEDLFWDATTDGAALLVNALRYAADRGPLTPGDGNGDGAVDAADAVLFDDCFTGPDTGPPLAGCVTFDFDGDDDVDCDDWPQFLMAYTAGGTLPVSENCGAVPTASQWGLAAMTLALLGGGTLVLLRRGRHVALGARS